MRKFGEFLLANDRNSALIAFVSALLPLLRLPFGGLIAAVIVGLVTLRKGYKSGLFVLAWVALPAIANLFLHQINISQTLLIRCILVWAFALVLRTYRSWQLVLEIAAVLGVVFVLAFHMLMPDIKGWGTNLVIYYLKQIGMVKALNLSPQALQHTAQVFGPYVTGIIGVMILFATILELLLSRWWHSAIYQPGSFQREFMHIRMNRAVALIGALIFVGAVFDISIFVNLALIMLLPFMFAGLSLFHVVVKRKQIYLLLLILVYLGIVFFPRFFIPLVALVGFVDSWYDFRRHLVKI